MTKTSLVGIILAAGRGSRMGADTDQRPKGLVPLAGKPMLAWQRDALLAAGCSSVVAIGGYRWEALSAVVDVAAVNQDWEETNMVATLACAADLLQSRPCLVSYSDIVYHPDHSRALTEAHTDIAITYDTLWQALWEMRFPDPLEDAETFVRDGTYLKSIGARPQSVADIEGQFMGLLRFTPAGWRKLASLLAGLPVERTRTLDMTSALSLLLADGVLIQAIPVHGRWVEVDSQADKDAYEARLRQQAPWSHDWRETAL